MDHVESHLERIEAALSRIEERLDRLERSCTNMDEHIGFVENVYGVVRRPLSLLTQRCFGLPIPRSKDRAASEPIPLLKDAASQ